MVARTDDAPTFVSYIAAAVSGALVVLLMGYLAYDAYGPVAPPRITAQVVSQEIRRTDGQAYVPVEVANEGEDAAAQIVVEVAAEESPDGIETVIDYLAGGESRRIVALVTGEASSSFGARVVSYQEP